MTNTESHVTLPGALDFNTQPVEIPSPPDPAQPKCGFCDASLPYHWRSCPYLGGIAEQPPKVRCREVSE